MEFACKALEDIESPGEIRQVPLTWPNGADWKDAVMRPHETASEDDGKHRNLRGDQPAIRHPNINARRCHCSGSELFELCFPDALRFRNAQKDLNKRVEH